MNTPDHSRPASQGVATRAAHTRRAWAEVLEPRALLSLSPAGIEFRTNQTAAGNQQAPATAMAADGDFVVAWEGNGSGDSSGVFARLFTADGVPQTGEFRVNVTTANIEGNPAVAMDADGNFVVAWQGSGRDGSGEGVFARRFNAAGVAQQVPGAPDGVTEFQVNAFTTGNQQDPAVAMDGDGDFVITWQSAAQDGDGNGIFARRYNAAGVAQQAPGQPAEVTEFRVNTETANNQSAAVAAMDADGDFVVAWESADQDGSGRGVFAKRYDAAGVAQQVPGAPEDVTEFGAAVNTAGGQIQPDVAMDGGGDFVVAWGSFDGSNYGIFARRFNAAGVPQADEQQVNTTTDNIQSRPNVSLDADGDFVMAWQSFEQDGSVIGVYARQFDAAGNAMTGEIEANTFTDGSQAVPSVSVDADSDHAVVAWNSLGQDLGMSYGVYAQRFEDAGGGDTVAPQVAAVFVDGASWSAPFRQFLQDTGLGLASRGFQVPGGAGGAQLDELPWTNLNRLHVRFSEDVIVDAADLAVRGVNTASYALNAGAFNYDASTFTATWVLAGNASFANDKILLDLNADADGVTDKAAVPNALDGEWANGASNYPSGNGSAGGDFRFQVNFLPGDVNRNGGIVNSLDVQAVRIRQFLSPGNPGTPPTTYTAFHDVDGSAFINAIDVQQVRIRQFTDLPDGTPALRSAKAVAEVWALLD